MNRSKDLENKEYPCAFGLTESCPVRKLYMLKPESLQPFCAICPILDEAKKETKKKTFRDPALVPFRKDLRG